MPYINTKTNVKITEEKERRLKDGFGKAVSILPGKSESRLMLGFDENCHLYFKGRNDEPIAFVEVKLFGRLDRESYNKFTAAVTNILNEELSVPPANVYVKYEECEHWGCNGANF